MKDAAFNAVQEGRSGGPVSGESRAGEKVHSSGPRTTVGVMQGYADCVGGRSGPYSWPEIVLGEP